MLPIEIPYPENQKLETGAVFTRLTTPEALKQFWDTHHNELPYAVRASGFLDTGYKEIYLREDEWIFAPSIPSVVKTVTRWDQLNIKAEWYDWRADKPDHYQFRLQDLKRHRAEQINLDKWSVEEERHHQEAVVKHGWWILRNLPVSPGFEDEDHEVFSNWLISRMPDLSDPNMPVEEVEKELQHQFFHSWHRSHGGGEGDLTFYDASEMDEYITDWIEEEMEERRSQVIH